MPAQPILQWVGGKKKLLPFIQSNIPPIVNNYSEPFVGGGIFMFTLERKEGQKILINDMNVVLTDTYTIVRDYLDLFITTLKHLQNELKEEYSKEDFKKIYIVYRKEFNTLKKENSDKDTDKLRKCALFMFLNKNCFCAVYRENSRGDFNVPSGKFNKHFFDTKALENASKQLKNVTILNGDFEVIQKHIKKNDFVFLDPPYAPLTTGALTKYTKNDFTETDQERVYKFCKEIDTKGAHFMLCNSNTKFITDMYSDYNIKEFQTNVCLNSNKDKRNGTYKEIIVCNY